jgi:hypothetical protein
MLTAEENRFIIVEKDLFRITRNEITWPIYPVVKAIFIPIIVLHLWNFNRSCFFRVIVVQNNLERDRLIHSSISHKFVLTDFPAVEMIARTSSRTMFIYLLNNEMEVKLY